LLILLTISDIILRRNKTDIAVRRMRSNQSSINQSTEGQFQSRYA